MLGGAQKRWFKSELLAAKAKYRSFLGHFRSLARWAWHKLLSCSGQLQRLRAPSKSPARAHHSRRVFWAGQPPPPEDHWSLYSVERREIADFVKQNGITGLCIIHGDAHMLAADNGSNADYATGGGAPIPVIAAAPLDQAASIKGGATYRGHLQALTRRGLLRPRPRPGPDQLHSRDLQWP